MSDFFKTTLESVMAQKAPGPSATFSVFHLVRAIEVVGQKEIGRGKLAESLKVGEGVARTIVRRLTDAELIGVSKAGCFLTEKGLGLWEEYNSVVKKAEIERSELNPAGYSIAILVRKRGGRVKSGMEQRDAAIMNGAKSAITMRFERGCLVIPSVSKNVNKDFPKAAAQVLMVLKPEENDAIVIVTADNLEKAEWGALAAMWTLLNAK
jgi:predicted transcriptional regulator